MKEHRVLDARVMSDHRPLFAVLEFAVKGGGENPESAHFDAAVAGQMPAGWTASITGEGSPRWTVERDPSAPSPPHALKQSAETPKPSYPLCLRQDPQLKDGFVEVKFKVVSGKIDQAAGVVWRAKDARNYYVCRANALEDNVVLYKVENGKRQALDIVERSGGYGVNTRVTPREWHTLQVEFTGPRFKVSLDGKPLFEVEDRTFPDAGLTGVWTKADSVTLFDDFRSEGR